MANGPGQSFKGSESYRGGTRTHQLTAAMGTVVQQIKGGGGGRLCQCTNPSTTAQTSTLSYYDALSADTAVASGKLLFQLIPGSTGNQTNPTVLDIPFDNGLYVVASAAITGTVLTGYV